ncbi:MAG: beta-N-acetylhexosaminidase [Victivallales bacterium]|nr:beta-N-acetylhexosaminidase [Victivallales bacterium]
MSMRGLLTGLSLMALSAAALEINNFVEADGFPVLVPSVQKLTRKDGMFAMPKRLLVAAPKGAEANVELIGKALARSLDPSWKAEASKDGEKAHITLELTKTDVPESEQGYTLDVTSDGISIKSRSPQGLFYGCQTFVNLLTNNIGRAFIPCCRIEDWPDLEYRGAFLDIRSMKNSEVDAYCRLIDVFGSLKLNVMETSFSANLPFENDPFTEQKEKLTRESIEKIKARAKANYIEIIPHLQVISHEQWLRTHPKYLTDITAIPSYPGKHNSMWNNTICFAKPLGRQLTDLAIRETVKLLKPKHFHICMDEFVLCKWQKCNTCKDGHTLQQLLDEVDHNIQLVKSLGVQPIIYHDQLIAARNGNVEMSEALMKAVPRDVVMSIWDYAEKPRAEQFDEFRKQGFGDRVGVSFCHRLTNTMTMPLMAKKLDGIGAILTYWGWLRQYFFNETQVNPHAAAGTAITAEYAWHCTDDTPITALTWDPAFEMCKRLRGASSMKRPAVNRAAIPIESACNARIGDDYNFPIFKASDAMAVAEDLKNSREPFQVALTEDGGLAAMTVSGGDDIYCKEPLTVPVNGKLAGITLLLTGGLPDNPQAYDYYHARDLPKVADFIVTYANGKTVEKPIRYRLEFNNWNAQASGFRSRFVLRGNDSEGHNYAFYAFDWSNLNFQEPVASFTVKPVNAGGVALAVLAANAFAPSDFEPKAGKLPNKLLSAGRGKVVDGKTVHVLADFENGMPGCTVRFEGQFDGKPEYRVIDDPTAPSSDKKVLELVVPPQAKDAKGRARAILDIELPKDRANVLALFADYCLSDPKANVHSGFYRTDRTMGRYHVMYDFENPAAPWKWQHVIAPGFMQTLTGKELPQEDLTTVRFSIWFADYDKPVHFRIDNVGYMEKDAKWMQSLLKEKIGK